MILTKSGTIDDKKGIYLDFGSFHVDFQYNKGFTKLHSFAERGELERLRERLKDTEALQTERNQVAYVTDPLKLINRSKRPRKTEWWVSGTPLHFCCWALDDSVERNVEILSLLLSSQCYCNVLDFWGFTPLFYAVAKGNMKFVEILLKYGADPAARAPIRQLMVLRPRPSKWWEGRTPIELARALSGTYNTKEAAKPTASRNKWDEMYELLKNKAKNTAVVNERIQKIIDAPLPRSNPITNRQILENLPHYSSSALLRLSARHPPPVEKSMSTGSIPSLMPSDKRTFTSKYLGKRSNQKNYYADDSSLPPATVTVYKEHELLASNIEPGSSPDETDTSYLVKQTSQSSLTSSGSSNYFDFTENKYKDGSLEPLEIPMDLRSSGEHYHAEDDTLHEHEDEQDFDPSPRESFSASSSVSSTPSAPRIKSPLLASFYLKGSIDKTKPLSMDDSSEREDYLDSPATMKKATLEVPDYSNTMAAVYRGGGGMVIPKRRNMYSFEASLSQASSQIDISHLSLDNNNNNNKNEDKPKKDSKSDSSSSLSQSSDVPLKSELEYLSLELSTDWNERFQRAIETLRICERTPNLNPNLKYEVAHLLVNLARDFLYSAKIFGRIIISELCLPVEMKTIKPIDIGGYAGGVKFVVRNILFKVAVDYHGLYGSDEAAAKVTGHELKGVQNCFNANVDIRLPFMCIVDYLGWRILAMSILPIDNSTIIYGSNDGGNTVHTSDADFNHKIEKLCKSLNLKGHICAGKKIYSCVDLEGHKGRDKHYYMCDFARMFPPAPRDIVHKTGHLYQLLRPELVKTYPDGPLCADAYSGFIKEDPQRDEHNNEITHVLTHIEQRIQGLCGLIYKMVSDAIKKGKLLQIKLTEVIHNAGINMRYLGKIRMALQNFQPPPEVKQQLETLSTKSPRSKKGPSPRESMEKPFEELQSPENLNPEDALQATKTILLIEMIARCFKTKLRARLRKLSQVLSSVPLEEPYRKAIVEYLNKLFGNGASSNQYWNTSMKIGIINKFGVGLYEEELVQRFSLKDSVKNFCMENEKQFVMLGSRHDGRHVLLKRIQDMTGVKFLCSNDDILAAAESTQEPLTDTDLDEIGERVKHIQVVAASEGYIFEQQAVLAGSHNTALALSYTWQAFHKFEEALGYAMENKECLVKCAELMFKIYKASNNDHSLWAKADEYFRRAMQAGTDANTLKMYAHFLSYSNLNSQAEEYFLQSLEMDPNQVICLRWFGTFLSKTNRSELAEKIWARARAIAPE